MIEARHADSPAAAGSPATERFGPHSRWSGNDPRGWDGGDAEKIVPSMLTITKIIQTLEGKQTSRVGEVCNTISLQRLSQDTVIV